MGKVLGLEGVLVKSKDPVALRGWYREKLGFEIHAWGGSELAAAGSVRWDAFSEGDGDHETGRELVVTLRVDDLEALLAQLRAKDVTVLDRRRDRTDGCCGYVVDPDGTLLELWEPAQ